jgi:hypothetical protein
MSAPIGNTYALGNHGGRPAAYETAEQLEKEVIAYFNHCDKNNMKLTVTGLTLFLGFSSRSSLDDYIAKDQEFAYILKRAKLAVENGYESSGQTIDIFALKNMGWSDKSTVEHQGGIDLSGAPVTFK